MSRTAEEKPNQTAKALLGKKARLGCPWHRTFNDPNCEECQGVMTDAAIKDAIEAKTIPELQAAIEKKTRETVAQALLNAERFATQTVERSIGDIIRGRLGFEKDSFGNNWRIDHCNGRTSPITNQIDRVLEGYLGKMIGPKLEAICREEFDKIANGEGFMQMIRREFKAKLEAKMRDALYQFVEKAASARVQPILDAIDTTTASLMRPEPDEAVDKVGREEE